MEPSRTSYDVVIVGGGHNGLTAAAYLARAGRSVLVLERLDQVGGAAVSKEAFPGTGVRLSRYSYLVSLLPREVILDLGLELDLRSRGTASYTPTVRDGKDVGLLVERREGARTRDSFRALTGSDAAYQAWDDFYGGVRQLAETLAPTLVRPLRRGSELAAEVGGRDGELWRSLVRRPLGETIRARFDDDLVAGVVATDALIGTFAGLDDPSLIQNRCFLYHLIGNGTGEWCVPMGGMGAVTSALARAARTAGADVLTRAGVSSIRVAGNGAGGAEVAFHDGTKAHVVGAGTVLANVAPWVLRILLGEASPGSSGPDKPAGSQLKINFLLDRLPRLRSEEAPETAFAGTFHVAEGYAELETAYAEAAAGRIPTRPPGELYCHSLTDPSVLGPLADTGAHTLTYFGLHMPASLFERERSARREEATARAIAAIDEHLAEPLMDCVRRDASGRPCIEAKVPQDVEDDLAMPGGHIFHGDLSWPWATERESLDTPARRWGVATDWPGVLLCGSGARRGGAVSGLGGHNAAMAVLEQ